MSVDIGPVVSTQLTRTLNVGRVDFSTGDVKQVLSANSNREKVLLCGAPGQGATLSIAKDSTSVMSGIAYVLPYQGVYHATSTPEYDYPPQGIELYWQDDMWAGASNNTYVTYIEYIVS